VALVVGRRRGSARVVPAVPGGSWAAAGNRFTKRTMVPPIPIGAYTGKIQGVPLTGGQASGTIPGYASTTGSITSPAAFTQITQPAVTVSTAGTYVIGWNVTLAGTLSSADQNNFGLVLNNSSFLATSVNPGAAGTYQQTAVTAYLQAGDTLQIGTIGAGTANSVYTATIPAASGSLTLQVGPQGLGTIWYPAQATLSTTTGPLDTSTCVVYLGVAGVPTNLVATVPTGNGTAALAVPAMQPGDFLIFTWTNGHAGDTAAFNILGTQDALTTGSGT
jgi:hypothetical protein